MGDAVTPDPLDPVEALRRIADDYRTHGAWTICFHCGELEGTPHAEGCAGAIARAALAALPAPESCHICGEPRNAPGSTVCSAAHADPLVPVAEFCPTCGAHESRSAPVPEGAPEGRRVCSHGIYHHGCPSCDRQDPEDR